MKHKLILFIFIFIVFDALLLYTVEQIRNMAIQDNFRQEQNSIAQSYESGISSSRNIAHVLFNVMINDDDIIRLFARAQDANEQERDVIRKQMYLKLKRFYEQEKLVGLKQLHFHLPDSTSFLRMHKPELYGDSLKGIRYSVEKANKTKEYVEGFEEGRIYNGFRFVFPIFYNMKHIGSVELSMSANFMVYTMDTTDDGSHDFIIKKSVVYDSLFPGEKMNYMLSGISDSYMREVNSLNVLNADTRVFEDQSQRFRFYEMMKPVIAKNISSDKPFSTHLSFNGKEISAVFMPVTNVKGEHVAYFFKTYYDEKFHTINRMFTLMLVTATVMLLLLLGFLYTVTANIHKTRLMNSMLDEKLTEQKNQLKLKEEMLFQQSKLATLGEMFSALAHQWKQPLNILAMYIQNMLDDEVEPDEQARREEIVEKCMAQITYMSETINDFMDFIRPSEETSNKVEMIKATEDILKLLMPSLQKKKIEVTLNTGTSKAIYASGNGNEIKHVMVNILNNAKDAIMEIKENDRMFIGKIDISVSSDDRHCIAVITDNGGGISSEVMDKLFNPYVTTKKDKEGSGLGLYMCRTIIEKHNGSLTVTNTSNGARFEIVLNAVQPQ